MLGDNHIMVNKVFIALLSYLLPRKLGLQLKGDALGNGDRTTLLAWWLTLGDPASAILACKT